jgi:hypothetical protein|tara:strand:- start:555 stop:965 length:411 start_codon:yes stop_codon:yes gene_type:complete
MEQNQLEKIAKEVPPTKLGDPKLEESKLNLEEFESFIKVFGYDNFNSFNEGKVYQKNKELNLITSIFKLFNEEIKSIDAKTDVKNLSLLKINKKLIVENIHNLNNLLNSLDIKEEKILYKLLGTMIQYLYELRERK